MKKFNNLDDMRKAEIDSRVLGHQQVLIDKARDSMPGELFLDWNVELGGYCFLLETNEELQEVLSNMLVVNNEYQFDSCETLAEGEWVHFFAAVNDAGGPAYYVKTALLAEVDTLFQ